MRLSDSFIERVLSGDGTEEEKQQVADFFRDHPEKLAQYLTEKSWETFQADSGAREDVPAQKMLNAIESRIGRLQPLDRKDADRKNADSKDADYKGADHDGNRKATIIRLRFTRIAAASLIFLVGLASLYYWKMADKNLHTQQGAENAQARVDKQPIAANLQTIRNTSGKTRRYSLPDGSTVKLASYSEVSFHQPFTDDRRDIFLQGQGVFTVVKDPGKPFAVHAGGLTTTALGTVFSVDDQGSRFAIVHLFSGRVVVRQEEQKKTGKQGEPGQGASGQGESGRGVSGQGASGQGASGPGGTTGITGTFQDVYLLPGQQLVLNKENFTVQVRAAEPKTRAADTASLHGAKMLRFMQQSLPDVLASLSKEYKATISYDSTDMKDMSFTGVYNHDKETLESFLGTLCDLNGLRLIKHTEKHFSIQAK